MLRLPAILLAVLMAFISPASSAADEPVYIVVDAASGAVLMEKGANRPWYPASVTKLMTAYLVFEALASGQLKPTSPVRMSKHAVGQAPSRMGYKAGTVLNVENALKMMMVKSANDVAVALAETVGGSEARFVARMNEKARHLGMNSTRFANPHGLPNAGQQSTARDLAVLARAILADFPEHRALFRIPAIKAGKTIMRSQNALLERYRGANGMKTGFICASGFNVVATAERNGRTLVTVVLGAHSSEQRTQVAARLMTQGFRAGATGRPNVGALYASPAAGEPANLRPIVCAKDKPGGEVDEGANPSAITADAEAGLVPRFVLMEPVPVYTGRADTSTSGRALVSVPMPNLRPRGASAPKAANAFPPAADDPFGARFNP